VEAHDPEAPKHHARRRTAEYCKQCEILGVKQRERSARHYQIEPVEADMPAQYREKRKHPTESEQQERAVEESRTPSLPERRYG